MFRNIFLKSGAQPAEPDKSGEVPKVSANIAGVWEGTAEIAGFLIGKCQYKGDMEVYKRDDETGVGHARMRLFKERGSMLCPSLLWLQDMQIKCGSMGKFRVSEEDMKLHLEGVAENDNATMTGSATDPNLKIDVSINAHMQRKR